MTRSRFEAHWLYLLLALASLALPAYPQAPVNDLCSNAVTIDCGKADNGTLVNAQDDDPDLRVKAGKINGDNLEDVYYLIDVPAGKHDVKISMKGLVGCEIITPALYLMSTSKTQPCDGPFGDYKVAVHDLTPEDVNRNRRLDEGEEFSLHIECVDGGLQGQMYVLEVATIPPNGAVGQGGFKITVECTPCADPAPGNAQSANATGSPTSTFQPGSPVYLTGILTPGRYNSLYVIPAQSLSDQQPIPDRLPDSADFVAMDESGRPAFSELELIGQSPTDPGTPDWSRPARAWNVSRVGSYVIVVDRDGDGLFDAGFDVITPTFHVQGGGTVPLMDGPIWFGALVLTVLAGAAFVLKNR